MNRRRFIQTGVVAGISADILPALASGAAGSADPGVRAGEVVAYAYPRISPCSTTYKVRADGQNIFVYHTTIGDFAAFGCKGPVQVEIDLPREVDQIRIAPARHHIEAVRDGRLARLVLPGPMNLWIEMEGLDPLYLFANELRQNPPKPADPGVRYFRSGQLYEVGELRLHDNETVFIEGGAVVRGCIRATGARNVRIAGPGILDGSYYRRGVDARRSIVFEGCRDSRIEDPLRCAISASAIAMCWRCMGTGESSASTTLIARS